MTRRFFSQVTLFLLISLTLACHPRNEDAGENVPNASRSSFALAPQSIEPLMPAAVARAFERSCQSCHGPAGHGIAAIAPDLRKGTARTAEQWVQFLTSAHTGATVPPPTWLNADEINVIAHYLVSLRTPNAVVPAVIDEDKSAR